MTSFPHVRMPWWVIVPSGIVLAVALVLSLPDVPAGVVGTASPSPSTSVAIDPWPCSMVDDAEVRIVTPNGIAAVCIPVGDIAGGTDVYQVLAERGEVVEPRIRDGG